MENLIIKKQALKDKLADIFARILRKTNKFVYFTDGTKMPRKAFGKVLTDIRTDINKIGNEISAIKQYADQQEAEERRLKIEALEAEWLSNNPPEEDFVHPEQDFLDRMQEEFDEDFTRDEELENDPAYLEMLESSRAYHEDMIYTEKDLNELKEELDKIKKTYEPPKVPAIEFVVKPIPTNRRFICGYTKDEKFVMVFWNYFKECSNGHGDLEKYYNDHFDKHFRATGGGFYMSNGHNNCSDPDLFYLFGRSDTFGNFSEHIEEITKYAQENKFRVIIGQTSFETGQKSNALLSMPRAYSA